MIKIILIRSAVSRTQEETMTRLSSWCSRILRIFFVYILLLLIFFHNQDYSHQICSKRDPGGHHEEAFFSKICNIFLFILITVAWHHETAFLSKICSNFFFILISVTWLILFGRKRRFLLAKLGKLIGKASSDLLAREIASRNNFASSVLPKKEIKSKLCTNAIQLKPHLTIVNIFVMKKEF